MFISFMLRLLPKFNISHENNFVNTKIRHTEKITIDIFGITEYNIGIQKRGEKMKVKEIVSRKSKKNNATIILELEGGMRKGIEKDVKKAIRKWNRLLGNNLSYKILIIERACSHQGE